MSFSLRLISCVCSQEMYFQEMHKIRFQEVHKIRFFSGSWNRKLQNNYEEVKELSISFSSLTCMSEHS